MSQTSATCPECGRELPEGTPPSQCPLCLIGLGLGVHGNAGGEASETPVPIQISRHTHPQGIEVIVLRVAAPVRYVSTMTLRLDNLPPSLRDQRETLAQCLEAMNRVTPLQAVYLFGSHARGQARSDSDVDLCLVAEGAERQLKTAQAFGAALQTVWPRPSFTLIPITPARLEEKKAIGDFFFGTVLKEGVLLAA